MKIVEKILVGLLVLLPLGLIMIIPLRAVPLRLEQARLAYGDAIASRDADNEMTALQSLLEFAPVDAENGSNLADCIWMPVTLPGRWKPLARR